MRFLVPVGVLALLALVWSVAAARVRPQAVDRAELFATARAAFVSEDPARIHPALAHLERLRPPPVDFLLEGLRSPNRGVREWSAHALGDLARDGVLHRTEPVVTALLRAFRDTDDWVRWKAARALGNLRARRALPALRRTLELDTEIGRASALKAVEQIEGRKP